MSLGKRERERERKERRILPAKISYTICNKIKIKLQ
jgi:hypothetical protein